MFGCTLMTIHNLGTKNQLMLMLMLDNGRGRKYNVDYSHTEDEG